MPNVSHVIEAPPHMAAISLVRPLVLLPVKQAVGHLPVHRIPDRAFAVGTPQSLNPAACLRLAVTYLA